MALDRALLEGVRGGAPPVLRFYRWTPACLSLGCHQPARDAYDPDALRARGLDVVRRPTGGRAVLHDRELTYSVVVPDRALGGPRPCYAAVNRALLRGLQRLGVAATLQPRSGGRAPAPSLVPCFRDPAEGEIVAGGRKLVGSAQVREGGVLLQHGSLLLEGDQAAVRELLRRPPQLDAGERATVLRDFRDPLPSWEELTTALIAGWEEELGCRLQRTEPSPAEAERARELNVHYADPAWTWRY